MKLVDTIKNLASVDVFKEARQEELFVGRPFYLDYSKAYLLVSDSWKNKVGGIPQGTFLLAFYENEDSISEALLLRAIKPTALPTDRDVISSMIDYYKDNLETAGKTSKLDDFTRYHFSFSGLECHILGTLYKDSNGETVFGADVENFYSAHNYSIYKPKGSVLEVIVNFRDGDIPGRENDIGIGKVRYSSSRRFNDNISEVPVYINPKDLLGKRTALFGMTRTGKSNTVKKIIEATTEISKKAKIQLENSTNENDEALIVFDEKGMPKYPVGQIIFDINGEYANPNLQDRGTAIYELYNDITLRYSIIEKKDFRVMKVNFYKDIEAGFGLICNHFKEQKENADYVQSFMSVSLETPEDFDYDFSSKIRYERKVAAYLCCLYRAGFPVPENFKVKFQGSAEINKLVRETNLIDPTKGISLEEASIWFERVWENYDNWDIFAKHLKESGKEWADEDLKAILTILSRHKQKSTSFHSGYRKLQPLKKLHSEKASFFENDILNQLREGKIVIIDLSQGDSDVQKLFSGRICEKIFYDSMERFGNNTSNNFIQLYFEEAHNLFPKKEDKNLSDIYNRIAKEGAKLQLGLVYATQEVSSISSNILKNTQNWFIAHLNNFDELEEIKKYYDFSDFADGLTRFSPKTDIGFVRMKTYSNPFIVPVQIDRFVNT